MKTLGDEIQVKRVENALSDGAVLGSMNAGDSKRGILHLWRAPSWAEIEAKEKEAGRDDRQ